MNPSYRQRYFCVVSAEFSLFAFLSICLYINSTCPGGEIGIRSRLALTAQTTAICVDVLSAGQETDQMKDHQSLGRY